MFIFIQRTEAQRDSVIRSHREFVVELEMNLDFFKSCSSIVTISPSFLIPLLCHTAKG